MREQSRYFIGVDLGTTVTKALIVDEHRQEISLGSVETRWKNSRAGAVEGDADDFLAGVLQAIELATIEGEIAVGSPITIESIGIAGLAESGTIIDKFGAPLTPVIAWFDLRGAAQFDSLPNEFKDEFSRETGLIFSSQCSLGKWLWFKENNLTFDSSMQWLNLLEYIAFRLTGVIASEPSLVTRTGVWSQEDNAPWQSALDLVGVHSNFIPPLRRAGEKYGTVVLTDVPAGIRGATVTVAGHDHAVACVGVGAIGDDVLFNSCGTADVLFRTLSRNLTNDERGALVRGGIGSGMHVLEGKTSLIGGTRAGLVLRRVLSLYDFDMINVRERLDAGWSPPATTGNSVVVTEPLFMSNEVNISLTNEASSQELWNAAIQHNLIETTNVLQHMNGVVGDPSLSRAAGGWARLRSIRETRMSIMPNFSVSNLQEAGAFGAASFAFVASESSGRKIESRILDFVQGQSNRKGR